MCNKLRPVNRVSALQKNSLTFSWTSRSSKFNFLLSLLYLSFSSDLFHPSLSFSSINSHNRAKQNKQTKTKSSSLTSFPQNNFSMIVLDYCSSFCIYSLLNDSLKIESRGYMAQTGVVDDTNFFHCIIDNIVVGLVPHHTPLHGRSDSSLG